MPTSPSSPRCIRCAATPAPRKAVSTPHSATARKIRPRRTPSIPSRAPTIWAIRTPSKRCAKTRPSRSSGSSIAAASSPACPTAASRSAPSAAPARPRTCYSADVTGLVILHTLWEQLERFGVKVYEEYFCTALAVEDGVGPGVVAYNMRNGELELITAKATIFATGGAGRMYAQDDQRLRIDRRRHGHRVQGGHPADGHGVHAVPPDDAQRERRAA